MKATEQAAGILERFRVVIDAEIRAALERRPDHPLYEMIRYHLGLDHPAPGTAEPSAGKRVRAALCCLSSEAAGGRAEAAAPAAAAVELVHSFTLLHDDVADGDETRRGRPTVWKRWGIPHAITAGDALFSLANLVMARPAEDGASLAQAAGAIEALSVAVLAVCEGQQMDISYEGRTDVTLADYLSMAERKTAALMAAACSIGARVGGGSAESVGALHEFGRQLGLGFQVVDDTLGIWGGASELGKPVGADLKRNKRSLPIVHALGAAQERERGRLIARLGEGIGTDEEAAEVARQLERLGSRTFCEETARQFLARALRALDSANLEREPREQLRTLAAYLTERTQ